MNRWLWGLGVVLAVSVSVAFSLQPSFGLAANLDEPIGSWGALSAAGPANLANDRVARVDLTRTAKRAIPRRLTPPAASTTSAISIGSYQQVLINRDRAAASRRPLSWSACLYAVAVANARRMAAQGYISHTSGPWADLACHLGAQGGENVGWWSGGVDDVRLNSMFMASPDHRANIMGPYHFVATAWAVSSNGFAYIAVEFA